MLKSKLLLPINLLLFLLAVVGCKDKTTMPNIILVMTDDQGYGDLSINGSPDVATPNVDRLASQSIRFNDFQVSPTCAPTRSAIMTGRHPFRNGITHTILERERMALGVTTLPEVLKRAGYTSGIFGKWHLGDEPEYQPNNRGFDEVFIHGGGGIGQAYSGSCADVPGNKYLNPIIKHNGEFVQGKGFCTDLFFGKALSWIKEQNSKDKPFFAYIATNAPHGPFIAPESYRKKFRDNGYSENEQGYFGMIENIDDNLGLLMSKLREWDMEQNTILIFMSDNGKTYMGNNTATRPIYNAGMKGMKGSVDEGGTRVPFYIRWSGVFEQGKDIDEMNNHYDILPTFADILNIDISDIPNLDGRSFLPAMVDPDYKGEDRYRFFNGGRWPLNPKSAENYDEANSQYLKFLEDYPNINIKNLSSKRWIGTEESSDPESRKYSTSAVRNEQYRFVKNRCLYDLYKDPGQTEDIASKHPEVVCEMREAYNIWWNQTKPFMVNETSSLSNNRPFWDQFKKQKQLKGIPDLEINY